ncbi:unnamed protein product [Schistosoma curassoni]|uniref:Peptidase A2 domain-containing protein n=1 Tax=Schistosoma curassoni TaxID=6186 RepID=A0A183JFE0_9TREM|nr:unnamed protein product [Schistosoma curassoni]
MVVGGSQQETLDPCFVLYGTRRQGVLVILRELDQIDRQHKFRRGNKTRTSKEIPYNSNVVITTKSAQFSSKRKYVFVFISGKPVKLQVHTGSDATLISRENWIKLGRPQIQLTYYNAKRATGTNITPLGEMQLPLTLSDKNNTDKYYTSGNYHTNLLGID